MSMGEVERATARLEAAIGRLEHRLSHLGNSKPDDAEIISGLQHGTISPVALRYLARRLRPYIRAQILSLAYSIRQRSAILYQGDFYYAVSAAGLVCAYYVDEEPNEAPARLLQRCFADKKPRLPVYRRNEARIGWCDDVEGYLVAIAIGEPSCTELRLTNQAAIERGEPPPESQLTASEAEHALVEPISVVGRGPRIVKGGWRL